MYAFMVMTYNFLQDGHPPHTFAAQFDCGNRVSCLTNTRVDIINEIEEWADQRTVTSLESSTPNASGERSSIGSRIFWINGSAGTGKTTIAYTMAGMRSKFLARVSSALKMTLHAVTLNSYSLRLLINWDNSTLFFETRSAKW